MADLSLSVDVTHKDSTSSRKHSLVDFVTSAGGAALITVLLGGVAAQLISCGAQRRVQQREFNNAWLKSRGDQALLARKEFIDARRAALDEIFRSAGTLAAASQDVIEITGPEFSMKGHTEPDRALLLAEQTRVTKEFRDAELAWGPSQLRFSSSVAYFGNRDPAIRKSWQELRAAVNSLRRCASETYKRWYRAGQGVGTYIYDPAFCQQEFASVELKATNLGETFGVTSDQGGWDNPTLLKQKLRILD